MRQVIAQESSLDLIVALLLPLADSDLWGEESTSECSSQLPSMGDSRGRRCQSHRDPMSPVSPSSFCPLNFHPQSFFSFPFPSFGSLSLSPTCSSLIEVFTTYRKLHTFKVNNLIHFDYNLFNQHHNQEKECPSSPNFLMLILIPPFLPFANTFSFPGNQWSGICPYRFSCISQGFL